MSQNEVGTGLSIMLVSLSLCWSLIGTTSKLKANKWVVFTIGLTGFMGTVLALLTTVLPIDMLHSGIFAMGTFSVITAMTELTLRAT